jgi:hypothetical protein
MPSGYCFSELLPAVRLISAKLYPDCWPGKAVTDVAAFNIARISTGDCGCTSWGRTHCFAVLNPAVPGIGGATPLLIWSWPLSRVSVWAAVLTTCTPSPIPKQLVRDMARMSGLVFSWVPKRPNEPLPTGRRCGEVNATNKTRSSCQMDPVIPRLAVGMLFRGN